jgi:DnaJ-class molecular chaperone
MHNHDKSDELEAVMTTCSECAGRGIIPNHAPTNKRNKKTCPKCNGDGEYQVTRRKYVEINK